MEYAVSDFGQSRSQFFKNLKIALAEGWSKEQMKQLGKPKIRKGYEPPHFSLLIYPRDIRPDAIKLCKIGWVRLKEKDYIPLLEGTKGGKRVNVRCEGGNRWFVSLAAEEPLDRDMRPDNGEVLGIDLGISCVAICSDGTRFYSPDFTTAKQAKKIRRMERSLARMRKAAKDEKRKVGKNYCKLKDKLARLKWKIANRRRDFIHKMTTELMSDAYPDILCIEDLSVRCMTVQGSKKKTKQHNRRNPDKKKRPLAKSILDVGFYEIRRQLAYKCEKHGKHLVVADRFFPSSKTCSRCGHVKDELGLNERVFQCEECGMEMDRDLNAAMNLKGYVSAVPSNRRELKPCERGGSSTS
jgi:putative transposase